MGMSTPIIDFYNKIGFVPTGQHQTYTHRRNQDILYRKLGMHVGVFRDSTILEVGPRSEENAIDLLRRDIKILTLVDRVHTVLRSIQEGIPTKKQITYENQAISISN